MGFVYLFLECHICDEEVFRIAFTKAGRHRVFRRFQAEHEACGVGQSMESQYPLGTWGFNESSAAEFVDRVDQPLSDSKDGS